MAGLAAPATPRPHHPPLLPAGAMEHQTQERSARHVGIRARGRADVSARRIAVKGEAIVHASKRLAWLPILLVAFASFPTRALERLEPAEGCYFGINLGDGDTAGTVT